MRKRRTREHIVADLSANYVERFFLKAGHTAERVDFDYGYDLFVQTFSSTGEIEPDFLLIQLKATNHLRRVADDAEVAVTVERSDLESWVANRVPVFLILYDARQEQAWWTQIEGVGVQRVLSRSTGKTVTLRINDENRITDEAVAEMRRIKNERS